MSVDQRSVGQMSVGQMSVGQMSVGQMSVRQMSIDQMSVDPIPAVKPCWSNGFYQKSWNRKILLKVKKMESMLVWKTGRERKKQTHMQTDKQKVKE